MNKHPPDPPGIPNPSQGSSSLNIVPETESAKFWNVLEKETRKVQLSKPSVLAKELVAFSETDRTSTRNGFAQFEHIYHISNSSSLNINKSEIDSSIKAWIVKHYPQLAPNFKFILYDRKVFKHICPDGLRKN